MLLYMLLIRHVFSFNQTASISVDIYVVVVMTMMLLRLLHLDAAVDAHFSQFNVVCVLK